MCSAPAAPGSAVISIRSSFPPESAAVTRNVVVSPVAGLRITSPAFAIVSPPGGILAPVAAPVNEVEDPRAGQRWVFRRTGGDLLEADLFVSPGGFVREHVHPTQEE